jgi:hypothetical protein
MVVMVVVVVVMVEVVVDGIQAVRTMPEVVEGIIHTPMGV